MEIKPGTVVEATYELYTGEEEGQKELMEKAPAEKPFQFIFGVGQTLDAFEKNLAGLKEGEEFDFTIAPNDAYGEYNQDHVLDLPKDMFLVNDVFDDKMIFPGNTVPMMDANGNRLNGSVLEVKEDVVVMDFNHPLAGETLHFVGKILLVREATEEELNPPHDCGCGCSSCNGHCGEEEHSCGDDNCGCGCGCH